MKQKGRKQIFGRLKPDNCRNQGVDGTEKSIFAGFQNQNKHKKMNANFVSKLAFRGGSPGRARTYNPSVNSRMFVQHRKTVSTIICDAGLQHGLCRDLCSLLLSKMLWQFFPLNNSCLFPAFSKLMEYARHSLENFRIFSFNSLEKKIPFCSIC